MGFPFHTFLGFTSPHKCSYGFSFFNFLNKGMYQGTVHPAHISLCFNRSVLPFMTGFLFVVSPSARCVGRDTLRSFILFLGWLAFGAAYAGAVAAVVGWAQWDLIWAHSVETLKASFVVSWGQKEARILAFETPFLSMFVSIFALSF
jgi:hypothetical protein